MIDEPWTGQVFWSSYSKLELLFEWYITVSFNSAVYSLQLKEQLGNFPPKKFYQLKNWDFSNLLAWIAAESACRDWSSWKAGRGERAKVAVAERRNAPPKPSLYSAQQQLTAKKLSTKNAKSWKTMKNWKNSRIYGIESWKFINK